MSKTRKEYLDEATQLYQNGLDTLNHLVGRTVATDIAMSQCAHASACMIGAQTALALRELAPAKSDRPKPSFGPTDDEDQQ